VRLFRVSVWLPCLSPQTSLLGFSELQPSSLSTLRLTNQETVRFANPIRLSKTTLQRVEGSSPLLTQSNQISIVLRYGTMIMFFSPFSIHFTQA